MEVVLEMPFLSLNNVNIRFTEIANFIWKNYIVAEVLSITERVEIIDKREFAGAALDKNAKTFIVHITIWLVLSIYLSREI